MNCKKKKAPHEWEAKKSQTIIRIWPQWIGAWRPSPMSSFFSFARHLVIQGLERPTSRCVALHVKCCDRSSLRRMHKMSSPQRKVSFLLRWQCSSAVKIIFSPYKPQATLLGQSRSINQDMGPAQSPDLSLFANLWNLSKGGNNEDIKRCFLNFFAHQLPLPTTFQVKQCLVCPPLFLNMLPGSPTVVVALRFDGLFFAVDSKNQLLVLLPSCWIFSHY